MKAVGIIVEFNPFHDGHGVHLRETRAISARKKIVAVMSGNFVQRGEPAICDKWRRTKMALAAGADIVIEIPTAHVVTGADYFARSSVGLLAATGVVDALSFGSECGDVGAIRAAGQILAEEPPQYTQVLREKLDGGASFAAARGAALEQCMADSGEPAPSGLFTKPNNGLAMEYCKALHLLGDPMEIFTTHRESGGPSATRIRRAFFSDAPAAEAVGVRVSDSMPDFAWEILKNARENGETATLDDFSQIFRYLLCTRDFDLGEGLENRFRHVCGELRGRFTISDFLAAAKTKRYTFTRLQRAVVCILLGISSALAKVEPQYIRVLGFRKESADLLGEITKKAALPVITHGAAMDKILFGEYGDPAAKMLAKDMEATDIYNCATGKPGGFRSERAAGIIVH